VVRYWLLKSHVGRTYAQYCGLARALDLVGERWTLLLVRDLALAPKRFGDMLAGLPGLGTSLLAERLRHLEALGLVERAVPPRPGRGVLYKLTRRGEELARAIAPLTSWGAAYLDPADGGEFRPEWLAFTLRSAFRREAAAGIHDCYELRLEGGAALWLTVEDSDLKIDFEPPRPADFVVETDLPTLAKLGGGLITPEAAVAGGTARFEGDPEAGWRLLRLFGSGDTAMVAKEGANLVRG
jgi:DNA-binding HxlR family transcriptional regulator/putative sterol carrier protein